MPADNASVSAEFQKFAAEQVESGRYANAREVFEAAKAALAREKADHDRDVEYVRQAIAEGEASGVYEGDAFADVRREMGWEPRS